MIGSGDNQLSTLYFVTECTEDDWPTSIFLASPHSNDNQLILRVSLEIAECDSVAIPCDQPHHPVTNHRGIVI